MPDAATTCTPKPAAVVDRVDSDVSAITAVVVAQYFPRFFGS